MITAFVVLVLMVAVTACFNGNKQNDTAEGSTATTSSETAGDTNPAENTGENAKDAVGLQAHQNEQIAGQAAWLYLSGTGINDPVVQAADNDYYLKRDEYGNPATGGCYYADYLCSLSDRDALNTNTVIYGHFHKTEDPNERKFTQLFRYCDIDFIRENPYMYLSIDGEDLVFQVAAVFFTDISFDHINPEPSGEELTEFFDTVACKNEFIFDGLEFGPVDRVLTLSTCSYRYDMQNTGNQRFVVTGKLLPEGAAALPCTVTENPNPERP